MATRTVVYRPSEDLSVEHARSSNLSDAYTLISDSISDEDSTYIYQTLDNNWGSASNTSTFVLSPQWSGAVPAANTVNVTGIRMSCICRTSGNDESAEMICRFDVGRNANFDISDAYVSSSNIPSSYAEITSGSNQLIAALNESFASGTIPEISVSIETSGTKSSGMKAEDGYVRITRVCVEVEYEIVEQETSSLYIKENNSWVKYSKVYKKQNGTWIEQNDLSLVFDENTNYVKKEV